MPDYEVDPSPTGEIDPIPEHVRGLNIPYRGIVDHGVPGSEPDPDDELHRYDGRPVEYDESPQGHDPEPIPVRIVSGETARQVRQTRIWTVPLAPGQLVQIVGRDIRRVSVRICNPQSNANDAFIGTDQNLSAINSWKLQPLPQEVEIKGTEPIYAISGSGVSTQSIQVLAEYIVEYK